jgi:hypothetical protein
MLQTLSNGQLFRAAPSVFATQPWSEVSDKYAFISTANIVERLRGEGLVPVSARQSNTRLPGKRAFARHEVRFVDQRLVDTHQVGGVFPQLLLTNSHDTGSAFAIEAGLYRLICSNGMAVPDGLVQSARVRHTGNLDDVIEGAFSVVEESKVLPEIIDGYSNIQLPRPAQIAFATAALELRDSILPLTADQLLRPRRREDTKADLWTTLNVVQENLVKGGLRSKTATGRRTSTRAVTDIAADLKLNRSLFVLAEALKAQL